MVMEGSDGSISSSPESRSAHLEVEDLKQALVRAAAEVQSVQAWARSQLQMYEARMRQLEDMVRQAQAERDEALLRCSQLAAGEFHEAAKHVQQHQLPLEDDDWLITFPSLDSHEQQQVEDESLFTTPLAQKFVIPDAAQAPPSSSAHAGMLLQSGSALASILAPLQHQQHQQDQEEVLLASSMRLPERGRLLDAVMQAGPLLQTLLVAGTLPQWHHPPPSMQQQQQIDHHHQQQLQLQQQIDNQDDNNNNNVRLVAAPFHAVSPTVSEQQQSSCVSDGEHSDCPPFVYKRSSRGAAATVC